MVVVSLTKQCVFFAVNSVVTSSKSSGPNQPIILEHPAKIGLEMNHTPGDWFNRPHYSHEVEKDQCVYASPLEFKNYDSLIFVCL
jgi:hypothetical protein